MGILPASVIPTQPLLKLVGNYLYLALAEVASKAATLAAFAYMARVIGREGMGAIEFASAAMLCAALAVDMGFGSYGAREIAKHPERTTELTAQVLFVRLLLGAAAFLGLIVLSGLANSAAVNGRLLIVFGLSLLCLPFLLQWVFQGHEWMGAVAGLNLLRQLIFAVVVFAALRGPESLMVVAWAEFGGTFLTAILSILLYRRWFGHHIRLVLVASREVIAHSATIGLSQVFWSVKMFGATVVLGLLVTSQQLSDVAYFGGAMRILVAMHAFIWLYYFNLLPAMARGWREGRVEFAALLGGSMRIVGWAALAGGWLWIVLSPFVMELVYGGQYGPAVPVLQWMGGVAVLAAISGHFRLGLIACGYQKDEMLTAALGAVVALVLIPVGFHLEGTVGAAAGLVVAEAVVWVAAWLLATRRMGTLDHAITLVKPLAGVIIVSIAVWLMGLREPLAQASIGVALYVIAGLVLDAPLRGMLRRLMGWPPRHLEAVARS